MSSEWVKAGKLWRGYCAALESGSGKSRGQKQEPKVETLKLLSTSQVSDLITRATMRELCLIAHDSGLVMVSHSELARRIGVSYHAIKRAVRRLSDDGYLVNIRKGSGSRLEVNKAHYANSRTNVYLLGRLPDEYGYKLPPSEYLEKAFMRYVKSPRYQGFKPELRQEVASLITNLYDFRD